MFTRIPVICAGVGAAAACAVSVACATVNHPADAAVDRTVIHVGGAPFFPVMLLDQCTADAGARAQALGVNLILNTSCASLPARPTYGVLPIANRSPRGPRLVGWTYPDEPESNGWTPETLARTFGKVRGNADGRVTFVTTGSGFFRSPYRDPRTSIAQYAQFAHTADVAGFDLYPLGHCDHDLTTVYDAQVAFSRLAGPMPTFQWIESGPIRPDYCGGFTMTPAELKAEVFLAVTGGARGIGYFTHTFTPAENAFDVQPAVQHAIRRTNALLGASRPGLLGQTVQSAANSSAIKVLARVASGKLYVFAVNAQQAWVEAQLSVPRLRKGSLPVLGEARAIAAGNGMTVDSFHPYGVHVYVQQLP